MWFHFVSHGDVVGGICMMSAGDGNNTEQSIIAHVPYVGHPTRPGDKLKPLTEFARYNEIRCLIDCQTDVTERPRILKLAIDELFGNFLASKTIC